METGPRQIVELIPQIQEDFHVRATVRTLPSRRRARSHRRRLVARQEEEAGVGAGIRSHLYAFDMQVPGVTLRELPSHAYAGRHRSRDTIHK
jgi:hypothetical protein